MLLKPTDNEEEEVYSTVGLSPRMQCTDERPGCVTGEVCVYVCVCERQHGSHSSVKAEMTD